MTEMYKIDKGIPIPSFSSITAPKYPWAEMQVGDSFIVRLNGEDKIGNLQSRLSAGARNAGLKLKRRFITRSVEDKKAVRCWRFE